MEITDSPKICTPNFKTRESTAPAVALPDSEFIDVQYNTDTLLFIFSIIITE